MKHNDVYEKIVCKVGLKEDKEYHSLYNSKDLYGAALEPLAIRNFKRFVGVLYYLIVQKRMSFDLIIGAGDSGIALTKITEKIYQVLNREIPLIINLPIVRFEYTPDYPKVDLKLFDNSTLIPEAKRELQSISSLKNILVVDDEIGHGVTLGEALRVVIKATGEAKVDFPLKVTLVAEDHDFKTENFMNEIVLEMYPFAKKIEGMFTVVRYIVPWNTEQKIREYFSDEQIGSKSLINLLLDLPIKETKRMGDLNIPQARFTYKERDLLKKEVSGFLNLQKDFNESIEKWIKEAIEEYSA